MWGDAPVITTPTEGTGEAIYPSRHPVAEVYARIEDDLNAAAGYIRTNAKGCYYATADNVNLLRADFALWMYAAGGGDGYLTMAETALGAVQSAGLLDRFADVFSISNKKNKEIAFALHLENGEYTSGSYFSYFIWGSTQIKAEYRNAPDGVPVSSNQWFLYSDDFIGFLKRSKELGEPADRCDLHGAHGRQRYVRSHPGPTSSRQYLYGHDGLGARISSSTAMRSITPCWAELRYHRKDYSGALTALNTLAQRAYGKANFYTDSSAAAVRRRSWTRTSRSSPKRATSISR